MEQRKRAALVALFALQVVCAAHFVSDEVIELLAPPGTPGYPRAM